MKSFDFRTNQLFLRNTFDSDNKWEIPLVKKEEPLNEIDLIAFSDSKQNDNEENKKKGIHFFIDDYRMERVYNYPEKYIQRLLQYDLSLTPDYSLYRDMPLPLQIINVFKNRWCGAYWQSQGIKVVPTISWSDQRSFDFCFAGVEKGSVVAVSTLGCRHSEETFMRGYNKMLEVLQPSQIICFGKPFTRMKGNIIIVDYQKSRRVKRDGR